MNIFWSHKMLSCSREIDENTVLYSYILFAGKLLLVFSVHLVASLKIQPYYRVVCSNFPIWTTVLQSPVDLWLGREVKISLLIGYFPFVDS
jgi:hypothetical protein